MARFKITKKETLGYIRFSLDKCVKYENGERYFIDCKVVSPYTEILESDYLEINLELTKFYPTHHSFNDTDIVRQYSWSGVASNSSSSTNIISAHGSSSNIIVSPSAANFIASQDGLNLARGMSRMVDETGKNWEYKIEVENKDGKKISHSLICRKN